MNMLTKASSRIIRIETANLKFKEDVVEAKHESNEAFGNWTSTWHPARIKRRKVVSMM